MLRPSRCSERNGADLVETAQDTRIHLPQARKCRQQCDQGCDKQNVDAPEVWHGMAPSETVP